VFEFAVEARGLGEYGTDRRTARRIGREPPRRFDRCGGQVAERRRTQLTIAMSTIGIILTVLASGLSYFGIKTFEDIKQSIESRRVTVLRGEKSDELKLPQVTK
jgi:hypothetical protein